MTKTFPLIFVVGPTAVGKSHFALQIAEEIQAAILNCDSVQLYQGLDIGTAKPTLEERSRVKHVMFDVLFPGGVLTAGDYRRHALPVLETELKSHPVLAVGGSGFYIQALEKGMFVIEKIEPKREAEILKRLKQVPLKDLYKELQEVDPETAEELNPNDTYRIQRAITVFHGHGKKLSELKKNFKPQLLPYSSRKLGFRMDRGLLRARVKKRTEAMLKNGFLDEVKKLLTLGLGEWPLLQSVGYKQVMDHLQGKLSETKLADEITLRTMQLAKRQMTWFNRDTSIKWFDAAETTQAREWLLGELDSLALSQENHN
jgi:tRNA dimethylallyltransferase